MASRKAKPREKKRGSAPDVNDRPSSSMTVEVDALSVTDLVNAARGSGKHVPPAPPTTVRGLDDLAATVEVPALSSVGPRLLLMDAAEGVIAERGYNHTTIRLVSEWAGVSVDVFHAHFADMRALLVALCERFSENAMNVVDEATRPSRWQGNEGGSIAIEYAIRSVVELMLSRAALLRAIFHSPERSFLDEIRRIGTHLTLGLTRLVGALPHPPDAHDVGYAVLSALAVVHHATTVGPEWSGIELDRDDIAKRAANAAVAYIESCRSR
jgi:AcrR family transcriptional regulator